MSILNPNIPLAKMTENTFKSLADRSFVLFQNQKLLFDTAESRVMTYAEGFELIIQGSEALSESGISKGDRVMTYAPLSMESVALCWACMYNGLVFVPVDHNWPQEMLNHIVEETAPKIILTDQERLGRLVGIPGSPLIVLSRQDKPGMKAEETEKKGIDFHQWVKPGTGKGSRVAEPTDPGDLAVILYTSGSTGIPKGVMLSQQALFNSGNLIASHFGWTRDDIFLNLGDLHSMSGLRNTCFAPLHSGSSFVISTLEERNNVLLVLDLTEKLGVHYIGVAPTVVRQLNIIFSLSRRKQISALKAILCTGGMLAGDQVEGFYHNYGKPVLNYYGLTETAGICAGHNFATFDPGDSSIGPAVGAELKIVPDEECSVEQGTGELLVKSDNLMIGYYKREKETNEALKDGWLHTGDVVRKREDGCFELLGRKKNFIKNLNSELIYLEEIENAIESFPLIKEASTCSYSRFEEDEKIVAFIVLKDNAGIPVKEVTTVLKKHLIGKIGKNRMPWCYYYEENLPRSSGGKVQRQILKERLNGYIQSGHKGNF